jgi:hypothetical protein
MQARTLGTSHFDYIKLATAEYHVGMNGMTSLPDEVINQCGFA